MRSAVLAIVMLTSLSQTPRLRDEWQRLANREYPTFRVDHTLGDAQITPAERSEIYSAVDSEAVHGSYRDDQREEERKAVLSAPVGLITLARNGSQQILVRAPHDLCGATGNCAIWVFSRERGKLRLILESEGQGPFPERGTDRGFSDLVVLSHISAFETSYSVYRWDGKVYNEIDCYIAARDRDHPDNPPRITDCGAQAH